MPIPRERRTMELRGECAHRDSPLKLGFETACVPRGTNEEEEVFESVVTPKEMEVGPPKPPCRGRL